MTRAPVVRLVSAIRASEVKMWLEEPENFLKIRDSFDSTSRLVNISPPDKEACGVVNQDDLQCSQKLFHIYVIPP